MVENGCSLEDCHTNLFALADLSGIKWRRLTVQTDTSNNGEPLEDAVLTSYSKCLQADLLCVWRRQPKGGGSKGLVDHSVASHKELWLFWYGDEPLSLQNYLSPDLYEVEMGSWENGTLSYECRTLIFKALHNLIERCLVSQRFVRMGKWFVQAYDSQGQYSKESSHLSMSFNFFLHGDSTVCASVDVRCHPPLFNIHHRHIQAANNLTGLPVILSPYGLAGNLTGRFLSDSDPKTESLFNEWNKYYCLFNNDNENNNNNSNNNNNNINSNKSVGSVQSTCATPNSNISDKVNSNPPSNANIGENINKNNSINAGNNEALPSFVEVIIAGMRLQYPSCYIKVTQEADDEAKASKQSQQQTATSCDNKARKVSKQQMKMMNPKRLMEMRGSVGSKVIDKAWQDWVLASGLSNNNSQQGMEASDQVSGKAAQWDFANPAQKFNCHCHKSKVAKSQASSKAASTTSFSSPFTPTATSTNTGTFSSTKGLQSLANYGSSGLSAWKHQQAKSENHPVRLHKNQTPYHRRHASLTSNNKDLPLSDLINFSLSPTFATFKNNPINKDNLKNVNTLNTSQFGSNNSNLSNNPSNASYNKSFFYQASEPSPNSAAPSPLLASQVISSASTQNGDPTMPTLSPQPSSKTTDCKAESNQKQSILNNLKQYNHQVDNGLTKSSTLSSTSASFLFQHFSAHDFKCDSDTILNNVNIEAPLKNELVSRVKSANVGRTWVEARLRRKAQRVRDRPVLKSMFEDDDEEEKVNTFNLHNNGSETTRYHPYPPSSLQLHHNDPPNNTTQNPLDNRLINQSVGSGLNAYDAINEARSNIPRNRSMLTTTNLEQNIVEPNEGHDDYRAAGGLLNNMNNKQNPMVPTLMTEDDLKPNIQDLDKMFDTDEEVDPDSPTLTLKHDKPREMTSLPQNINTSKLLNSFTAPPASFPQGLSVKDLSRMFPTPPSADNPCSEPSPLMHTSIEAEHHDLQQHPFIREELALVSANLTNLKKNCSGLFKFPILTKLPASSQYKCINLHSSYAPYPFVYKPQSSSSSSSSSSVVSFSSQRQHASKTNSVTAASISNHESLPNYQQEQQKYMQTQQSNLYQKKDTSINQQQQSNISNNLNNNSNSQQFQHNFQQMNQQHTPLTYDLMSPASNTSSINKQLHSIDNNNSIVNDENQIKGLTLNIGLSDSILNIFKDQNFDSCTLCACNRNIQGADINMYLPLSTLSLDHNDDQFRCTCAFSAIINRRYGHNSGLFYEDEVEITGHHHKRFNTKNAIKIVTNTTNNSSLNNNLLQNNNSSNAISPYNNTTASSNQFNEITAELFSLFREQFSSQFPGAYVVDNYNVQMHKNSSADDVNVLEMKDCTKVCYSALGLTTPPKSSEQASCVHKWSFYQASAPLASNSREVVRLLKRLQPLLQDAIQKRRTTRSWESVYTISGPLTWKDFHLLAGRGSRETSEPKSLPCLLVGHDKQWLNIAPHSVRHWERMMLGPLGEPKDVFFLAIAPDNDLVVNQASLFFKQLGVVYEQCRLGKHRCLMDKSRDLVVRVGRKADDSALDDQWFWDIGNSSMASKLRLYAKICSKLASEITKRLNEKRKLYEEATRRQCMQGGNRFSISNPDLPPFSYYHNHLHPPFNQTSHNNLSSSASCNSLHFTSSFHDYNNSFFSNDKKDSSNITSGGGASSNDVTDNDSFDQSGFSSEVIAAGQLPYVVLYIIDPFNYTYHSSSSSSSSSRLGMLGILKCYQKLVKMLPEDIQLCVQLQIIPQQLLLNPQNQQSTQHFKNISFSVYTACKRQLKHTVLGRSLTSFGPAFSAKNQVQKISQQQIQTPQQQQLVPYNSNNSSPKLYLNNIKLSQGSIFTSSLFCPPFVLAPPYCQVASILQPENWKEQTEKSGILLCAYCLSEDQRFLLVSVVDNTGELLETTCVNIENSRRKVRRYVLVKMWEFLMGVVSTTTRAWRLVVGRFGRLGHGELRDWGIMFNKKNLLASSQQLKKMCSSSSSSQCPSILSACLVSTEMHPFIHIMLDSVKKEESQSSKRQLNTPRDASCSHILVYPTSATAQATDNSTSDTHMDFTTNELLSAEELLGGIETEDADMNDFWSNLDDRLEDNHHLYDTTAIDPQQSKHTVASTMAAMENEENSSLNLLQQPQAMGFYVSTAPPGPLPQWFWSSCPQRQNHLPVCFKASLHLHSPMVQQNQDDLIHHSATHKKTIHPLDSYLTCDVLRYVLETYNALSWLTIDPCTNDRKCCLPVHMMVLMQLYHGLNTFL